MKQVFAHALIGVVVVFSTDLAVAGEAPQPGVHVSTDRPNSAGKTRAQIRAELKDNRPTATQKNHEIAQSVTGFAPVSRAKTSP